MADNSIQSEIERQTLHSTGASNTSPIIPPSNPDEINLLEYIYVLVKNKWWIIGAAVLGLVLGYGLALKKGPTFVAEAVIAAKENENKATPNLSGFGAFGGLVASQLNIGGNPGLDKIDLILGSRKFNAEMIEKYDLLPMIYREQYPKIYRQKYDTTNNRWNDDFKAPNLLSTGDMLLSRFLKKEVGKNGTMIVKIESIDSTFCDTLMNKYLLFLNEFIQYSVKKEADDNLKYLENRLEVTSDPLLREKLQGMIANEVEKAMLVSTEAFKIIDPPLRTYNFKAKKFYPLVCSAGFFFIITILVIIKYSLINTNRTEEDRMYIDNIMKYLWLKR